MRHLTVQIEENQHEWLKQKCFEEDISMASYIRAFIEREMEEEENEAS